MTTPKTPAGGSRARKLSEAMEALRALGFASKQANEIAGYTLLALLELPPTAPWRTATAPQKGITTIIEFVSHSYKVRYAPNTRETFRDEAVKHFVEAGMLLRNPDHPLRPTNSGKTVYQMEPVALRLFRSFGSSRWNNLLNHYLSTRAHIRAELDRSRKLAQIPVRLPNGSILELSPGGQNPLIKAVIEAFCPRFTPAGTILYVGDAKSKFLHLDSAYLKDIGVTIPPPAKMPDVVVHDSRRHWLLLIEAVTSAGPVDGKRRMELKHLFAGSRAGLVFVTAFQNRESMRAFLPYISWETEVWVASDPDHLIHFNGERFLGPYPDATALPALPLN